MSRRKIFKPIMMTAGLCLTMWQLPQMLGAIDAAKNPSKMSKFLEDMSGGKPADGASSGVSALMPGSAGGKSGKPSGKRADSGGELTLFSPTGEQLSDEDRAKLLEQAHRNMPRADAQGSRGSGRARTAGKRKSANDTITDAVDELNRLNPR